MTQFYKMTGSGNDFVMFDGRQVTAAEWPADRIAAICSRRYGVGADGLVILTPGAPGAVRMEYFNADGSRASMCGNAALCSTRLSAHLGIASPEGMILETDAGSFPTRSADGPWRAELNLPPAANPEAVAVTLEAGELGIWFGVVGVPHATILVQDIEAPGLMDRGRRVRHDPAFREGANVNFLARKDGRWTMRTYERGVEGETWACGTGAVCAALSLALYNNATLPMEILTRGDKVLSISAVPGARTTTDIWLAGEGRLIFQGDWVDNPEPHPT